MRHEDLPLRKLLQLMLRDRKVRRSVAKDHHDLFFHCYFNHYVKFRTAPFQKEMFRMTENAELSTIAITAFRGSAKSTIMNLSYTLWAILGAPQKKFILLVGLTQAQARQHLKNIKEELENNDLLRGDLGPFREEEDEWRNSCLVVSNYGAKIMAVSIDQAVRGLRHGPHRPDLTICDDIEDLTSVKTKEGRDRTYQWVKGELIPAGDTRTRIVFIGNLLHEDCLLKRLEQEIGDGVLKGVYREFPLINAEGKCLWPGKYPTEQSIQEEKSRIGSEAAWYREYLLRILSDTERVIHPEWIRYYDDMPVEHSTADGVSKVRLEKIATGVDLAISKNDTADYTAMVTARLYFIDQKLTIYILPNPINQRMTSLETLECAKNLANTTGDKEKTVLFIEDVGYQSSLVELLKEEGYEAEAVPVKGQDKRGRLALASHAVQSGQVLFPRKGAEILIDQLVNFGIERYDDLADAFSMLVIKALEEKFPSIGMYWIGRDGSYGGWDNVRGKFCEPANY